MEIHNPRLGSLVYNYKHWIAQWPPGEAPLSLRACADLPSPHIVPRHSHVFGQASILQPTCSLWQAHMGDTKRLFYKHAIKVGRAWMKRYKLPDHSHDQWASFLVDQWDLHNYTTFSQEVRLCATTSHLVRLPADHHPHRVHLTCHTTLFRFA